MGRGLGLHNPSGTGELLCLPPGFGPWCFCCQRVKRFLVRQNVHWGSSIERFFSGKKRNCLKTTTGAQLGTSCSQQRLTLSFLKALLPPTIPGHRAPGDSSCKVLRLLSQLALKGPRSLQDFSQEIIKKNIATKIVLEEETF